ncbi:hypothetical protein BTGOE3_31310 [Bacillus thuringiensis]|nr:hypothetical protein BTGOE3_31310 [Bacillus thuringiensis]
MKNILLYKLLYLNEHQEEFWVYLSENIEYSTEIHDYVI